MADEEKAAPRANPGYAFHQLAKLLSGAGALKDPDKIARARKKIRDWYRVLEGMLAGRLKIGSRAPVASAPGWATLEVAHGGFATGRLCAGGELEAHERALLAAVGAGADESPRAALNAWYLSDAGLAALRGLLADGRYRVQVPEEGALLAAAALLERGRKREFRALIRELTPWFATLRFYPWPAPRPGAAGAGVRLQDLSDTIWQLEGIGAPASYESQREAIEIWAPLEDRAVALLQETVAGEPPSLAEDAEGRPARSASGAFAIMGGWPCQRWPEGWRARATALVAELDARRAEHARCRRFEKPGANLARLRLALQACAADPARLSGREVGMLRLILAQIRRRRGLPCSERLAALRARQAAQLKNPTASEFARVLAGRLRRLPGDEGLDGLDEALAPVRVEEAPRPCAAGRPIPEAFRGRLARSLNAPVERLIELGVISSGESLALVIPRIVAELRAAGLGDPRLARLYAAVYRAFRRRRSVLLLNLESQVKLRELPWVRALESLRAPGEDRAPVRRALEQAALLAVGSFPHAILPNKLSRELRALAEGAGLAVPLVDELAADIFMGQFSEKFPRAAREAAALLEGTLYERYYGLSYARVRALKDPRRTLSRAPVSPGFAALCCELAGESFPKAGAWAQGWSVARSGKIVEAAQVLTTHNLAALFRALGLAERLGDRLDALPRRCFDWICAELEPMPAPWQAKLRRVKNCAYAWRQLVFYLALRPPGSVAEFLAWAGARLGERPPELAARLRPAVLGLAQAARGEPVGGEGRRFWGWTTGAHWLLAGEKASS